MEDFCVFMDLYVHLEYRTQNLLIFTSIVYNSAYRFGAASLRNDAFVKNEEREEYFLIARSFSSFQIYV